MRSASKTPTLAGRTGLSPPRVVADCVDSATACRLTPGTRPSGITRTWARWPTLSGFQSALTAPNVAGDWSNNPANFVGLDWILSFPNKYAYLDLVDGAQCDGGAGAGTKRVVSAVCDQDRVTVTLGSGHRRVAVRPRPRPCRMRVQGTANLCLNDNDLAVWDTEEQEASGNVSVSPGTRTTLDICNELQVFTLAPVGTEPRPSVIQTAERRGVIAFENLDAIRGWGRMDLSWPPVAACGATRLWVVSSPRVTPTTRRSTTPRSRTFRRPSADLNVIVEPVT